MMYVEMTELEYQALQHAKKYAKNWDYFILIVEAYIQGYKKCKEDVKRDLSFEYQDELWFADEIQTEVEFDNGEHQLSSATFERWRNECQKSD